MLITLLTAVALIAATLSGLTGIGGGTLLIVSLFAAGLSPAIAVPIHAVVQLVSNGTRTLAYGKHVNKRALAIFLLGAVPAPFLVAPYVVHANPDLLRLILGVFVILMLQASWISQLRLASDAGLVVAGIITTGLGMFVGATGVLIAPFYLRPTWSKETIIATLALTQACAHLLKIAAFASYDVDIMQYWDLWLPMSIAVILGTGLGRYLNSKISGQAFVRLFKLVVTLLAIKLIYDGCTGLWA